uniref:30S ribosomal protein S7 n=1 Tax=Nephromyces sp. ex Molgula occidentalis TaxID=2544991 RepID=A0A5C1H8K3_9APIC|nr:30S ribosomal protein S7 [Nephromyces sp. ex Molgula occidentalis]
MVLKKTKLNIKITKVYNPLIILFLNKLQKQGNKNNSEKILNEIFLFLKQKGFLKPEIALERAIFKLKLPIILKSKIIGGTIYKIPVRINFKQSISNAISLFLESSKQNKTIKISKACYFEIINILNDKGNSIFKVQNLLKQALSLRVFSTFY